MSTAKLYAALLVILLLTACYAYFAFFESGGFPEPPFPQPPSPPQQPSLYPEVKEINWLMDRAYENLMPGTGLSICWDELSNVKSSRVAPQLMAGALFYAFTGNQTHLDLAEIVAEWMANGHIADYFENQPAMMVGGTDAKALMVLCELAKRRPKWTGLLRQSCEWFKNNRIYNGFYDPDRDGNVGVEGNAKAAMAFAQAGSILNDPYYKEMAVNMILNYKLGAAGLPPHKFPVDTSYVQGKTIDDDDWAWHLIGAATVYYYTRDSRVKDLVKVLADAGAKYVWNAGGYFQYRTDPETGASVLNWIERGDGRDAEAMVLAYLIWGNKEWLDKAETMFTKLYVNGFFLRNYLEPHAISPSGDVLYSDCGLEEEYSLALRSAMILYCLTGDSKYLNFYHNAMNALIKYFKKQHGWCGGVDVLTLSISTRYTVYRYDANYINFACIFANREHHFQRINSLDDLFRLFGTAVCTAQIY